MEWGTPMRASVGADVKKLFQNNKHCPNPTAGFHHAIPAFARKVYLQRIFFMVNKFKFFPIAVRNRDRMDGFTYTTPFRAVFQNKFFTCSWYLLSSHGIMLFSFSACNSYCSFFLYVRAVFAVLQVFSHISLLSLDFRTFPHLM